MYIQHWALQRSLLIMGHSPFLIRTYVGFNTFFAKRFLKEYNISGIIRALFSAVILNMAPIKRLFYDSKRRLQRFQKEHIIVSSHKYYSLKELQIAPPSADAYIVGSDQVWSGLLSDQENEIYYLNFGDRETRRISYAPSFSMIEYPELLQQKLKECLGRFDYLSCRESTGVEICKHLVNKNVETVLDPTFLVSKTDYLQLMGQAKPKLDNGVFIYSLNIHSSSDLLWNDLKKIVDEKDVIVTFANGYLPGDKLFGTGVLYSHATMPEWLSNIYYSRMVITPSFHGIALSIILERDFVYVPLKEPYSSGNSRVLELLDSLDLNNRVLSKEHPYSVLFSNKIDWDKVRGRLTQMIDSSRSFLSRSLLEDKL